MDKSPQAFRTISEVATLLETPAHVLRFWETRFPQIRPVKRAGGRRYYRPNDVALLTGIKYLLHAEGMTIRGVQKVLRDHGVRHVAALIGAEIVEIELDAEAALNAALNANFADHLAMDDDTPIAAERAESATIVALETALTRGDSARRNFGPSPSLGTNVIDTVDFTQSFATGFDQLPEGETPTLPGFDLDPPQPARRPQVATLAQATAALRQLPPLAFHGDAAAASILARARALHHRMAVNPIAGAI